MQKKTKVRTERDSAVESYGVDLHNAIQLRIEAITTNGLTLRTGERITLVVVGNDRRPTVNMTYFVSRTTRQEVELTDHDWSVIEESSLPVWSKKLAREFHRRGNGKITTERMERIIKAIPYESKTNLPFLKLGLPYRYVRTVRPQLGGIAKRKWSLVRIIRST